MTVGQNIRRIRQEKGLTQKQLGELCGINEANIRKYESDRQNAKIETLKKIADALQSPLEDLVDLYGSNRARIDVEELTEICEGLSDSLGSVMRLSENERDPFYNLIKNVIIVLRYCRCIEKENNTLGQNTAMKEFILASVRLSNISTGMAQQAIEKYESKNISKKHFQITFSSQKPENHQD